MAKRTKRREWTKDNLRELKAHSRSRTPVKKISKLMKTNRRSIASKGTVKWECRLGIGGRIYGTVCPANCTEQGIKGDQGCAETDRRVHASRSYAKLRPTVP